MTKQRVGRAEEQWLPEVPWGRLPSSELYRNSRACYILSPLLPSGSAVVSVSVKPESPLAICTVPQPHPLASALRLGSLAKSGASLGLWQEYLGVRARCCLHYAPGTLTSATDHQQLLFQPNVVIILPTVLPKDHLCNEKAGL